MIIPSLDDCQYLAQVNILKKENERLRKKIIELEQDLVHAHENVYYRECDVALRENDLKALGVHEFIKAFLDFYNNHVGGINNEN